MYPCTSPLLPSISRKKHCFSSVFAKMMSKNTEFFQIFGKRMQEAQASKKAGRGNRAWDPCFATPGPRRLRLVERHQIAARSLGGGGGPPPPPPHVSDVGWGGVRGGGYPLSSLRCPTRREMSADNNNNNKHHPRLIATQGWLTEFSCLRPVPWCSSLSRTPTLQLAGGKGGLQFQWQWFVFKKAGGPSVFVSSSFFCFLETWGSEFPLVTRGSFL